MCQNFVIPGRTDEKELNKCGRQDAKDVEGL